MNAKLGPEQIILAGPEYGAVLKTALLGDLNSIDVYLLVNARLGKTRFGGSFADPVWSISLLRWPPPGKP
jgi:hypothetical protein